MLSLSLSQLLGVKPQLVSQPDPDTGFHNPFPNFAFTGSLRPVYPLSPKREVPASIPHPDYAVDGIPKKGRSLVRMNRVEILDEKAQQGMRKVCRLAREVLDVAAAALRPGITTDEIDEIVHKACIERNVSLGTGYGSKGWLMYSSRIHHRSTITTSLNPFAPRSTRSSATASPIDACSWTATLSTST